MPASRSRVVDRIEDSVAQEFKSAAMEAIRAGMKNDVDSCAAASKLRLHRVFFDSEFADGVRRRLDDQSSLPPLVIVHAIEQEIIVERLQAIDGDRNPGARIVGGSAIRARIGVSHIRARSKVGKLDKVPAIERQFRNALFRLDGSQGRSIGGDQRRFSRNLNRLILRSHLHRQIHANHLVHPDDNIGLNRLAESGPLGSDAIGTGVKRTRAIGAVAGRGQLNRFIRCRVGDRYSSSRNDRSAGIGDDTGDTASIELGMRASGGKKHHQQAQKSSTSFRAQEQNASNNDRLRIK